MNDHVDEVEIQLNVRSRRTSYDSNITPADRFIVPLLWEKISETIENSKPGTVIDVGCGEQPFRQLCIGSGMKYFSFDTHQNSAESVDYLGSIDSKSLVVPQQFDLVLCTEVLEHVFDWNTAFCNLYNLTVTGGTALVTCPFVYRLHEEPSDYWRPTPYAIRRHAIEAGFVVQLDEELGEPGDVLGMLLFTTGFRPTRPGVTGWLVTSGAKIAREVLRTMISWNRRRRLFTSESVTSMYVSNFFILRKP